MRKLSLLLALTLLMGIVGGAGAAAEAAPVEITFLSCWNGGGGNYPEDQLNNPVMQEIIKQTG
ncbi:MAG: ABC transporter substrate-binding protein, partial [Clostridiales bacterium]|nr:ABC transporter substrate-binding protein [Clostridiales bacterium]